MEMCPVLGRGRSGLGDAPGRVHYELDDIEPEDMLEAIIAGRESEAVLFAQCRDPDVVLLYRDAGSPKECRYFAEGPSRLLIGFEHTNAGRGEEAFERGGVLA
jgi:hypothetical protein